MVKALLGIYVDDLIGVGRRLGVDSIMQGVSARWKTGGVDVLTPENPLVFLGLTLHQFGDCLYIEQHGFTRDLLRRFASDYGTKTRHTTGEHTGFGSTDKREEDKGTPDDLELVRRQQAILGSLLWLSTRSRPDLSFAVARASSHIAVSAKETAVMTRHLLQYLHTHPSLGIAYTYGGMDFEGECGVSLLGYGDSSYAPMGLHSQTGFLVFRVMTEKPEVMHLVSWGSTKQKGVIAQSSCEAELLALKETHHQLGLIGLPMEEVEGWHSNRQSFQVLCDNTAVLDQMNPESPPNQLQIKDFVDQGAWDSRNGETGTFVYSLCTYGQTTC
eukprot:6460788-Amphidinium_carterae.1